MKRGTFDSKFDSKENRSVLPERSGQLRIVIAGEKL
jgi:hypothetical protein